MGPAGGKSQPGDDRFLRGGLLTVQAAVQAHGRGEPAHRHDLQGRREGRAQQPATIRLQELCKKADGLCGARVARVAGLSEDPSYEARWHQSNIDELRTMDAV